MGMLGTTEVAGRVGDAEIRFETGKLAGQAHGSVVAHLGETILLVNSTASSRPKEHLDFFPLTVDYEERMYAAGKIPGGFFKREGRPSENAILTARLVDRPMRPTFEDGLRNEIQILILALSADQLNPPDVLAINGASLATMLAGIPFDGPVAGLRMAMDRDGAWTPFPTFRFLEEEAVFDLVVAGRLNVETDQIDILMVEAEATASAVEKIELGGVAPTEEILGDALEEAKTHLRQLCDLQVELAERAGTRESGSYPLFPAYHPRTYEAVEQAVSDDLRHLVSDTAISKSDRNERLDQLREAAIDAAFAIPEEELSVPEDELERQAKGAFRSLEKKLIRQRIVNDRVRIDGRGPEDIRPLSAEVGLLPRAHGTGLFRRGETQALTILTLGMLREAQRLDTIDPDTEKRYIHHYNFPPFSTGETGFMRGPKRREIGHGALAERALLPVIPDPERFPYALRLVSEVLSSNGSTSMASVCGSTLALMDGGVPIAAPVAGIAMGLVAEDARYMTLTDIQGAEDAFGDMDFKVAGTSEFVTALQLDTKLSGIPAEVLGGALRQAKQARLQILDVLVEAIPRPRDDLRPHAPRVLTEYIPADKIGEVIGPKGKIIREITEETGADVDIEDVDGRGVVHIYSSEGEKAQLALDRIRAIANPVIPQEGERYYGTVVKTADFGAFVSLTPGNDGLLHISKLGGDRRLAHADEAVQVGDKMWVEVAQVKDGRKFSLDLVDGPGGEDGSADTTDRAAETPPPRSDRGEPSGGSTVPDADAGEESTRQRVRQRSSTGQHGRPERQRGTPAASSASAGSSPEGSEDDEPGDARRRRRRRRV